MGWFKQAMCNHQLEKIGELKDSEKDTTAIKVIRMCCFCGYSIEKTFTAPDKPGRCTHRWRDRGEKAVIGNYGYKTDQVKITQRCDRCGEYKTTTV